MVFTHAGSKFTEMIIKTCSENCELIIELSDSQRFCFLIAGGRWLDACFWWCYWTQWITSAFSELSANHKVASSLQLRLQNNSFSLHFSLFIQYVFWDNEGVKQEKSQFLLGAGTNNYFLCVFNTEFLDLWVYHNTLRMRRPQNSGKH